MEFFRCVPSVLDSEDDVRLRRVRQVLLARAAKSDSHAAAVEVQQELDALAARMRR